MTKISVEIQAVALFPVVAAALIDDAGRVLVQQRPPGKQMAGLWEFPGGKLEPGETPEAALVRELDEELGIVVDPAALRPATFASELLGDRSLLLLLYLCRSWSGDPVALDAVAVRWVTLAEMRTLDMPPADAPFIAALERMI
ncbi:(deoxy)nucleoside triphosphate pyrophosphohydrolase [Sphingomonas aliaeris]|uniref:8-oxo-dGTP diphosphatase n=1 Tax=Sphingomonas aliaeris TaxID=2759526 RepID=A0A974S5L4_9SPHN|nr:(deoxy)nucleoside triphosphate pyrophosphohydrolase [Sphingomonas aliaeris]QQV78684.1 (deoxy)nucleoside triphosphate pyrophosphohydrolase [Sphingomonas aliaeris]